MKRHFTGPPVLLDGRYYLMKQLFVLLAILGLITTSVSSQKPNQERDFPPRGERGQGGPGPHRHGPPPHDPILMIFDTDQNNELSTKEMEQASTILLNRDHDKNGVLTPNELPRPPHPRGAHPPHRKGGGPGHHQRDDCPPQQRGAHPPQRRGADSGHHHSNHQPPKHHRRGDRPPRHPENHPPHHKTGRPDERQEPPLRNRKPQTKKSANVSAGTVIFTGGYETDPRDQGRPVKLIAAALGVKPEVFRQAFSNVKPERGGDPTPARAQANKKVLLDALGKYGITNERLDTVSNYYRYRPGKGNLWKHTPASAKAIIKDGQVTGFKIINAGSGYMTPPTISIAGNESVKVEATLKFSKNFKTNGSINSLKILK